VPGAHRALIRYFLSEGHDLVNEQGTRIRRHELESTGCAKESRWIPFIYQNLLEAILFLSLHRWLAPMTAF
jgi:hypothetical protein